METEMMNPLVGVRLRALRGAREVNQDVIASLLGLKDRQSVSALEKGERRAKPEELAILLDHFELDSGYFTDPFRLVGEGEFSWRQSVCSAAALNAYQKRAGNWLATYRALSNSDDRPGPKERLSLRLSERSTFEAACAEGERLSVDYNMGAIPAQKLPQVMENDFGILVLMVDMDQGISGAACRLPEMDAVLVNRLENPGRRNFDLAHEFFHILTWDAMPPKSIEEVSYNSRNRVEQLANNFAAALLMPSRLMKQFGEWRALGDAERAARMRQVADHFQVSVTALHWRLVALKLLTKTTKMVDVCSPSAAHLQDTPPLFSKSYVRVLGEAIEKGRISASKAVKILGLGRDAVRDLFATHSVPAPVTL